MRAARAGRALVAAGSALAVAGTAHAALNLRLLRTPPDLPGPLRERVTVLLPLRDEEPRAAPCLRALRDVLAQTTALVVAHRASTVLLADRVALLQDGRVAAVGRHTDLLTQVPAYRALLSSESQLAGALTEAGSR